MTEKSVQQEAAIVRHMLLQKLKQIVSETDLHTYSIEDLAHLVTVIAGPARLDTQMGSYTSYKPEPQNEQRE